jgi:CubicO group peptidase (beta-lactamase class C family)
VRTHVGSWIFNELNERRPQHAVLQRTNRGAGDAIAAEGSDCKQPQVLLRRVSDAAALGRAGSAGAAHHENPRSNFFSGGGGLRSTVWDYYRFAQFVLNGGELDGVRLLKATTVRQMTTNQVADHYPDKEYGWDTASRYVSHRHRIKQRIPEPTAGRAEPARSFASIHVKRSLR